MPQPPGTLTDQEFAEIQAIADHFQTVIDVVGSRAAGEGENIETDMIVRKLRPKRSDIDFRIDSLHSDVAALIAALQRVGRGAGRASTDYSTNDRETFPPFIRFVPNGLPVIPIAQVE